MSPAVSTSTPAWEWSARRSRPMRQLTASSLTANVPPNPQHSSGRDSSHRVSPSRPSSSFRALLNDGPTNSESEPSRSSRSPWQLLCSPTRCGKVPVIVSTPTISVRNSQNFEGFLLRLFESFAVPQKVVVMMSDHRHTTSGWCDDVVVRLEDIEEPLGERRRCISAAGVRHRLAAAGLAFREVEIRDPESLQHPHHRHADVRIELIDVAGNEETDAHGLRSMFRDHGHSMREGIPLVEEDVPSDELASLTKHHTQLRLRAFRIAGHGQAVLTNDQKLMLRRSTVHRTRVAQTADEVRPLTRRPTAQAAAPR